MAPERRAVLLLLGLAVLGQGVRIWAGRPEAPPGELPAFSLGQGASPRAHHDSSLAQARPLAPGERIDLDRATAQEVARLPRVGLTLARAIVAEREASGPFANLAGLDRVPGVGPGLLAAIGGHVTFSGTATNLAGPVPGPATPSPLAPSLVPLNTATAAELERLPFVGPYMARQVVAYRERHGAFPAVDSLLRVPGIGPATLARIRDRLSTD